MFSGKLRLRRGMWICAFFAAGLSAGFAACVPSYGTLQGDAGSGDGGADRTATPTPDTGAMDSGQPETSTAPDAGDAGIPTGGDAAADSGPFAYGLAAGGDDTCLIKQGIVYCWGGQNQWGQLGTTPDASTIPLPRAVDNPAFASADAVGLGRPESTTGVGYGFTCALAQGAVYCWGYAESDQRGNGSQPDGPGMTLVPFLTSGTTQITLGAAHACALYPFPGDAGNVACWGATIDDATGPRDSLADGHHVIGIPAMSTIAAGGTYTCGITQVGSQVLCWGASPYCRAGVEPDSGAPPMNGCNDEDDCTPRAVSFPPGVTPTKIGLGRVFGCALTQGGGVYCWGIDRAGELGQVYDGGSFACPNQDYPSTYMPMMTIPSGIIDIAVGEGHTCAVTSAHNVLCWGWNPDGQVGNGTESSDGVWAPSMIYDPTSAPLVVDEIASGANHTCALSGQSLYCWGAPTFVGNAGMSVVPQLVPWP